MRPRLSPSAAVSALCLSAALLLVRAELGAVWIDKTNDLNGTHLDFDAALAFDVSERVFVEYRPYSHGKKAGIAKNASNDGWNLFGVGVTF